MATQPVLHTVSLPYPRNPGGYSERRAPRAVSLETANSNLVFQRLNSNTRREFTLVWVAITTTQYDNISSAYSALIASGTDNFTAPTGDSYTVTVPPGAPPLDAEYIETPGGVRWNVTMRLREVTA